MGFNRKPIKKLVAIVPARAGSKGLANKCLLEVGGIPLYQRAVDVGKCVADEVVVTTDIESILRKKGTSELLHKRSKETSSDTADMDAVLFEVIQDLNLLEVDILLLQPTSPLRTVEDVNKVIQAYATSDCQMALTVSEVDSAILKYFISKDDELHPISDPKYCFSNRQSLPKVVRPDGAVYLFSTADFLKRGGLNFESYVGVETPECRSIDIDDQADLNRARELVITCE